MYVNNPRWGEPFMSHVCQLIKHAVFCVQQYVQDVDQRLELLISQIQCSYIITCSLC